MEGLAQIQEAIEAAGQGETPEAKDIDVNKELQSFIDSIGGLEFANNKDFKAAATDIIKALVEWYAELQQQYNKDRDDLVTILQDRFKKMDKAITEVFEFTESVENLRFFLLLHTARLDYAFHKLVEMGLIENWTKEMWQDMWSDDRVSLLGYDCSAKELRQRLIDNWPDKKNEALDKLKATMTDKK